MACTTELEIRLKEATVGYTMELSLLVITKAKRDVVESSPHKQLVIIVDVSRRLTIRNRRFSGCAGS